ncbi:MAG: immunoglobulin domain-containing protein [Arachnia sp.]
MSPSRAVAGLLLACALLLQPSLAAADEPIPTASVEEPAPEETPAVEEPAAGPEPAAPELRETEEPDPAPDPDPAPTGSGAAPEPEREREPARDVAASGFVTGETTTRTLPGGATVTYNAEVRPGEPIRLQGTGWLAKPDRTEEGQRGSVIGVKLIDDEDLGQLQRRSLIENPRLGVPIQNDTVWGAAWADDDGDFVLELEWPDADNAVATPTWGPGASFTVQLLSGTLYSDQAGVDPSQRPDVSRTVPLTLTVAGEAPVDPEEPVDPEPKPGAVTISAQPQSRTAEAGTLVTFTAAATGDPAPTVVWQRSTDGGATWADLRGATGASYTIERVRTAQSGQLYRAVFTNAVSPDGVATEPATLSVTPRGTVQTTCGTSYGPGAAHTGVEFCFKGPEKVVAGKDIVIEGVSGYLATDDATGSVVNFFLDAEYSGDPNTVFTKRTVVNPATGKPVSDKRTHAVVQARPDGSWTATIPWPTVQGVDLTQAEIDKRFAPGTEHSIRILSGSLLTSPADRQRGASLLFTVVQSLSDEVRVTEPVYEHHTFRSTAAGDTATAWLPRRVASRSSFTLSGTGWLTKDRQWGSTVAVRLVDAQGTAYRRPAGERPVAADPTVWQVVRADELGDVLAQIPLPGALRGGDYLAVQLSTVDDGTPLGDVARSWTSPTLTIDNVPYVPPLAEGATCTAKPSAYTYELAPGMKVPAANVGGTIRLRGANWCNLVGGGSLIAVKINAGGYQHLPTVTAPQYDARVGREVGPSPAGISASNKTIWYVIEADEKGAFDVQIPLPTRKNSLPGFTEGAYTLQLLTRTISADPYYAGSRPDPSRSIVTREFTVVAEGASLDGVKPGKPTAVPDPLHVTDDLTAARRGGVDVTQRASSWVIAVPRAEPGDWVYINVFDGSSPRFPWGQRWFAVDDKRQVTVPVASADLPTGTNKLSVQDRSGALLGWDTVTVAAPRVGGTAKPTPKPVRLVPTATRVGAAKPAKAPAAPVAAYADLDEKNAGTLPAKVADGKVLLTVAAVPGGDWVYPFLYTETGRVVGADWVQVGTDHTLTVSFGTLPNGTHKLALVGMRGTLLGWVAVDGPAPLAPTVKPGTPIEAAEVPPAAGSGAAPAAPVGEAPAATSPADPTWTLVLIGLAVLVLAGSGVGVILLRTPAPARP